jgi:hypothetical protein
VTIAHADQVERSVSTTKVTFMILTHDDYSNSNNINNHKNNSSSNNKNQRIDLTNFNNFINLECETRARPMTHQVAEHAAPRTSHISINTLCVQSASEQ